MSPRFLKMIPFLWEWEGTKFENDPDDPGGATKYGIDQRSHPHENIRQLTEDRAKQIYWDSYWQPNGCEYMPPSLGESHFDACVNTGKGRAVKFLAASNRESDKYNDERDAFYHRLVEARPRSAKYLKGWLNRTSALRRYIAKLA